MMGLHWHVANHSFGAVSRTTPTPSKKHQTCYVVDHFYPLEIVSRYRDPQFQVGKNYFHFKWVKITIIFVFV